MARDVLLVHRAADESEDPVFVARRMLKELHAALADGEIDAVEAMGLVDTAEQLLEETLETKYWANEAAKVESAFETARRGGALNPTPYKRERFRAAGLDVVIDETTNEIAV